MADQDDDPFPNIQGIRALWSTKCTDDQAKIVDKMLYRAGELARVKNSPAYNHLSDTEKEKLAIHTAEFLVAIDEMITSDEANRVKKAGMTAISQSVSMRAVANTPERFRPAIDQQANEARMERARAPRTEQREQLAHAIRAVTEERGLELKTSEKFASRIQPEVRKHLSLEPEGEGWPTARTIKAAISAIKKGQD